jgi:hypothetical protein
MNLKQAWDKAKDGDRLLRESWRYGTDNSRIVVDKSRLGFYFQSNAELKPFSNCSDSYWADDWEVERKPMVWEGEVTWEREYSVHPEGKNLYYNLEPFIGKRTRIRIEEII